MEALNDKQRTMAFVNSHKEKTRALQRATEYIRVNPNRAVALEGWTAKNLCDVLATGLTKPIDVIVLPQKTKEDQMIGSIVSVETVFPNSKDIIFQDNDIFFKTSEGAFVSIDEYEYIREHGLNGNELFGVTEKQDGDVMSVFKSIGRRAQEARKDKGINIFYLTIGSIVWKLPDEKNKTMVKVRSPLFLVQVKEDLSVKDRPRFVVVGNKLQVNPILAREIKTRFLVDIYRDVDMAEIPFSAYEEFIEYIKLNVKESPELQLLENDFHLCLLDSTNEVMCQAIERSFDDIVQADLTSVFSGEKDYVFN